MTPNLFKQKTLEAWLKHKKDTNFYQEVLLCLIARSFKYYFEVQMVCVCVYISTLNLVGFFSKYGQIRRKMRICSHLLKVVFDIFLLLVFKF